MKPLPKIVPNAKTNKQVWRNARIYQASGLNVIPTRTDENGHKAPCVDYRHHMRATDGVERQPVTAELVNDYFPRFGPLRGIAVLTNFDGTDLFGIDFDDQAMADQFLARCDSRLLERLTIHETPRQGGGIHIFGRTAEPHNLGKQGLAYKRIGGDGSKAADYKAGVETTNYVLLPGSGEGSHPAGAYAHIGGPPITDLQTFTLEELDEIVAEIQSLCQKPKILKHKSANKPQFSGNRNTTQFLSVVDDYNENGSWADEMYAIGAEFYAHLDGEDHYTRSGKDSGTSYTCGKVIDNAPPLCYCFTSSDPPFEKDKAYNLFGFRLLREYGDPRDEVLAERQRRQAEQAEYDEDNFESEADLLCQMLEDYLEIDDATLDDEIKSVNDRNKKALIQKLRDEGFGAPELTELGIAERAIVHSNDELRFVVPGEDLFVYDNTRYQRGGTRTDLQRFVVKAIEELHKEDPDNEFIRAFQLQMQTANKIASICNLVKYSTKIHAPLQDFDQHPELFNVLNGTIDLHTNKLRPHDKKDLLTQRSEVVYDPEATCPRFDQFIDQIMLGREELVRYLQQLFGYTLYGCNVDHSILAVFHGDGRNGKGALIRTMQKVFGLNPGGYASALPPKMLKLNHSDHPTILMPLYRARLATIEEEESKLDQALVKMLTGGDMITARRMKQDFVTFTPSHQLFLSTNHPPPFQGNDLGIRARIKLIPFQLNLTEEDKDPTLEKHMADHELPGILNWCLQGWRDLQENSNKMCEPGIVTKATQEMFASNDVFAQWLNQRVQIGIQAADFENPDFQTSYRELRDDFQRFAFDWGDREMADLSTPAFQALFRKATRKAVSQFVGNDTLQKRHGIAYLRGVRLLPDEADYGFDIQIGGE